MLKQKQPNGWSCLPTSFAIALGVPVSDIFDYLEHDGSEEVFPGREEPYNRRSFHPQELIDYSMLIHDTPVVQIDKELQVINTNDDIYDLSFNETRMDCYLSNFKTYGSNM